MSTQTKKPFPLYIEESMLEDLKLMCKADGDRSVNSYVVSLIQKEWSNNSKLIKTLRSQK